MLCYDGQAPPDSQQPDAMIPVEVGLQGAYGVLMLPTHQDLMCGKVLERVDGMPRDDGQRTGRRGHTERELHAV